MAGNNNHRVVRWRCDYCRVAIFGTFDEAADHMVVCLEAPKNHRAGNNYHRIVRWRCDYCLVAVFGTFDEAADHELVCLEAPKNRRAGDNNHRVAWRCDCCLVAVFGTFDEAVNHERVCLQARESERAGNNNHQGHGDEGGDNGIRDGNIMSATDQNKKNDSDGTDHYDDVVFIDSPGSIDSELESDLEDEEYCVRLTKGLLEPVTVGESYDDMPSSAAEAKPRNAVNKKTPPATTIQHHLNKTTTSLNDENIPT